MLMRTLSVLLLASLAAPAIAADKVKDLTVEQALGIGAALKTFSQTQLGDRAVPVSPGTYKFNGRIAMQMAVMQQQVDVVTRAYQEVVRDGIRAVYGDEDPAKLAADPKRGDENAAKNKQFQEVNKKALAAPAGIELIPLRQDDLCLDAKPPVCPQANPISVETLTLLLPVLDRQ